MDKETGISAGKYSSTEQTDINEMDGFDEYLKMLENTESGINLDGIDLDGIGVGGGEIDYDGISKMLADLNLNDNGTSELFSDQKPIETRETPKEGIIDQGGVDFGQSKMNSWDLHDISNDTKEDIEKKNGKYYPKLEREQSKSESEWENGQTKIEKKGSNRRIKLSTDQRGDSSEDQYGPIPDSKTQSEKDIDIQNRHLGVIETAPEKVATGIYQDKDIPLSHNENQPLSTGIMSEPSLEDPSFSEERRVSSQMESQLGHRRGTGQAGQKKFLDEAWTFEIEKMIESRSVVNLHDKIKIDKSKISSIASTKEVIELKRRDNRQSARKQKEKTAEKNESSPFKIALDHFEDSERDKMKRVRRAREMSYYSALRESEWDSSGLPSIRFDKCELLKSLIRDKYKGEISCFGVSSDEQSLMLVGTDQGDVLEIDLLKKKVRKESLGTKVTSLDISPNREYLAAGLASGEVFVKKTGGSWVSKRQRVDENEISQVRFSGNSCLVAASDRNVLRLELKDMKLMVDITKKFIIQSCREVVTQVCIMPSGALNNAIVTTVASVRMFLLAEKDTIEIFCVERPEYCHQDAVPSVSWLSPEDKDFSYILVFWDFYVFLIKNQGPESTICGMKRMDKQLVWGCVLRNRTIAVLHLDFELCLESIQSMFTNLVTGAGFETKFQLTKSEYTCGKPKDSDSGEGAPQKWSESIRCFQNSIFFLKKDGISSIYLLSLREMAFAYAEQGHWLPSLKLCVEVCNKKIRADSIETTEIRVETTRLATAYVDRFVDRSKRNEELQGKILRVSMDALIGTENEDFLFESLRMKFDEIVFWQVIQGFVEAGMVSKVPVKALKDGAMFLQKEELEWVLQNLVRANLEENEDEAHVLMQIVKKRKLWPSLYRLGLIWPQENLGIVLGTMMAELMFSQEEVNLIFEKLTAAPQEERKGILVDPKLGEYIRVFWFLKSIVNWQMVGIEEYRKDMEVVWLKVVGWMMDPSNIKVLSSTNINAYLEVYFDLFLNVEFSSSKRIALDLKSRLESLKSQIGILEPEKEMEAPKSPFSPSKKRSRKRKDSTGPAIKEEEEDEEEQAEHLLLFKAIIQNLFQFANPDQSVNIAFLALKLMTLSMFNRIYRDSSFLKTIIVTLLSWPFLENQLWFNYEYVKKEDFEEKIVRVMSQFSKTKEFQTCRGSLQAMAVENGFRRVNGYLIETISGAVGALKYYMSNSMAMSHQYLFNWIKKMVVETQNEKDKREFCTNVMKSLGDLVGFSNPDEDQQEEDERNCTHFALCRPGTSQVPRVALYYS